MAYVICLRYRESSLRRHDFLHPVVEKRSSQKYKSNTNFVDRFTEVKIRQFRFDE